MSIIHIVAMGRNRVIGDKNSLPWASIDAQEARFNHIINGSAVIMGYKTYQRLGAFNNARNIVLSSTPEHINELYQTPDVEVYQDLNEAIASAKGSNKSAVIIGGASLFTQTMHCVDTIHLTMVDVNVPGDASYPELPGFSVVAQSKTLNTHPPITFMTLNRTPTFK